METDSIPVYLTAGRYLIWVASSLITTALALVNGYYFHDISKTYWAVFIPLQVCAFVPSILYVICSSPRPTSPGNAFLKSLHYTMWQGAIQLIQVYLVLWLSKHWRPEQATLASLDVIFVFNLGLNIAIFADYIPIALLIQPIQVHWERAEEYLTPNTLDGNPRQGGAVDQKVVKWRFFHRLLIFYNRIFIPIALTTDWLPMLLFKPVNPGAWEAAWEAASKNTNWSGGSAVGYGILMMLLYPIMVVFPLLLWKCQVGQECRRQDGQERQERQAREV